MSFIAKEVSLTYQGDEYSIPISMGLINRIESAGVNLFKLQIALESGDIPPISLISTMLATMLNQVGANVTPEDVWEEINHGETVDIIQSARALVMACFPKAKESRNKKKATSKKK